MGVVGNALTDKTWYDETGAVIKSYPAGSEAFTKTEYDSIGQAIATYTGYYNGGTSDNPLLLTDNAIFEQVENDYDEASNVIETAMLSRYHDNSGTGSLVAGTSARPSYTAFYFDGIPHGGNSSSVGVARVQ